MKILTLSLALSACCLFACSSQMATPIPDMTVPPECTSTMACPGSQKCNAAQKCVACVKGGDCMPGSQCVNEQCVPGCDANNPCPMGQVCDPVAKSCVQCSKNGDCAGNGSTTVCNLSSHMCVGCVTDDDCGAGSVCHAATCATGCSGSHPACPMAEVCNVGAGMCVGCLSDGDCKDSANPRCQAQTNTCVPCLPTNDNCAAGQYCSGTVCSPGCRSNSDCASNKAAPQCDTVAHQCVGCVDDTGCGIGTVCKSNTCVTGCNAHNQCPGGQGCCNGLCAPLATDKNNCGACGTTCSMGQGCCNGSCVSTSTVANCGACGNVCGAGQNCCATSCINVLNDAMNCGACGNVCAAGSGCCAGTCVPLTSLANCGSCGNFCPDVAGGTRACTAGKCAIGACTGSLRDCNMTLSDGCEANILTDAMNCGACGTVCKKVGNQATCTNGVCVTGPPMDSALVAYWPMENSGANVNDLSGNSNTGAVTNATQVTGKVGNGYQFNGNGCITVPNSPSLAMAGSTGLTVMAWVNSTVACNGDTAIVVNKESTYEYKVGDCVGGQNDLRQAVCTTTDCWSWHGAHVVTANAWHHVVITYDGQNVLSYIDGTLTDTYPQTGGIVNQNSGLGIGCRSVPATGQFPGASSPFTGIIDEVAIYKRALSASEITAYYNSTK